MLVPPIAIALAAMTGCSSRDDCGPVTPPATTAAVDGGPSRVTMREGVPSEVEIDDRRYRFGIRGTAGECRVAFTVLHDGRQTAHVASPARRVTAAGVEWVVVDLSDDPARVVLGRPR